MPKTQFHPSLPCRNSGFSCGYSAMYNQLTDSQVTKVSLSCNCQPLTFIALRRHEPQAPTAPSRSNFPFRVGCYWAQSYERLLESITVVDSNMAEPAMSLPENRVPQYNFTAEHRVGLGPRAVDWVGQGAQLVRRNWDWELSCVCHVTGYVLE